MDNNDRVAIFYCWQSTVKESKDFLDKIIEQLKNNYNIIQATTNFTGSENIVATVYHNIEHSDIFICDLSYVIEKTEQIPATIPPTIIEKYYMNQNVLFELGYAVKTLGWDHIICLIPKHQKHTNIPFDISHNNIRPFDINNEVETFKNIKYTIDDLKNNLLINEKIFKSLNNNFQKKINNIEFLINEIIQGDKTSLNNLYKLLDKSMCNADKNEYLQYEILKILNNKLIILDMDLIKIFIKFIENINLKFGSNTDEIKNQLIQNILILKLEIIENLFKKLIDNRTDYNDKMFNLNLQIAKIQGYCFDDKFRDIEEKINILKNNIIKYYYEIMKNNYIEIYFKYCEILGKCLQINNNADYFIKKFERSISEFISDVMIIENNYFSNFKYNKYRIIDYDFLENINELITISNRIFNFFHQLPQLNKIIDDKNNFEFIKSLKKYNNNEICIDVSKDKRFELLNDNIKINYYYEIMQKLIDNKLCQNIVFEIKNIINTLSIDSNECEQCKKILLLLKKEKHYPIILECCDIIKEIIKLSK